jgi:hypothetical protein
MQTFLFEGAAETVRSCSALAGMPADARDEQLPMKPSVLQMFARSNMAQRVLSLAGDEIDTTNENSRRGVPKRAFITV